MRTRRLGGAAAIGCAAALAACQPYYYGYGGYGPYAYGAYRYAPYGVATAPYNVPQPLSQSSYDFVVNLALNDSYEIEAARVAAPNSGSAEIRRFADRMANEYTLATQRLTIMLQRMGTPVVIPEMLDPRHDAMIRDLAVPPPEFDRRYVIQQVVAHRDALAMLQNYAQSGDNPALRQVAVDRLPMVQEHLRLAQLLLNRAGV